jgi:hypothetical protein
MSLIETRTYPPEVSLCQFRGEVYCPNPLLKCSRRITQVYQVCKIPVTEQESAEGTVGHDIRGLACILNPMPHPPFSIPF